MRIGVLGSGKLGGVEEQLETRLACETRYRASRAWHGKEEQE